MLNRHASRVAIATGVALMASCANLRSGESPRDAREAAFRGVAATALDLDGDGHVGRYEAAIAAMGLVEGSGDMEGADVDALAAALEERVARGDDRAVATPPLSFTVEGERVVVAGNVDALAPARFLEVLATERQVNEIVLANVESAPDAAAAEQLVRMIEASGLATRAAANGVVAGPGVEMLAAGSRRTVEAGARIGVRQGDGALRWLDEVEIEARGLRTETMELEVMVTGTGSSLRGLAAVDANVAWATGSRATVVRTVDGGASWEQVAPDSIEGLDVRDVTALSADVAWIMCAGPGEASRILFTEDGGRTWTEQHREVEEVAFLDGMAFWSEGRGVCYGDPMEDGRFRVLWTVDGGATWTPLGEGPLALETGEASFAASGTGVRVLGEERAWIVTGATDGNARVFVSEDGAASWSAVEVPVAAAKPGAGAFSVSFRGDGRGVIVGGDYLAREVGGVQNAAWSSDFGKSWQPSEVGPRGQRAGSAVMRDGVFIATGQTGIDVSRDGGRTWRAFSSEGFHCVEVSGVDGCVWFAGSRGRVGRLVR